MQSVTTKLTVPTVSCGHCVSAITKEVQGVAGVEKVEVSLTTKEVTIVAKPEVSRAVLVAAINEAGYDVQA